MSARTFSARMPHLIAAFVPLLTSANLVTPFSRHYANSWLRLWLTLALASLGLLLMFWAGTKKYAVTIDESTIKVAKKTYQSDEITCLRLTKQSLNIITGSWRRRGLVTFDRKDMPLVVYTLKEFAERHHITLEIK